MMQLINTQLFLPTSSTFIAYPEMTYAFQSPCTLNEYVLDILQRVQPSSNEPVTSLGKFVFSTIPTLTHSFNEKIQTLWSRVFGKK